jgi:hypothetical protein
MITNIHYSFTISYIALAWFLAEISTLPIPSIIIGSLAEQSSNLLLAFSSTVILGVWFHQDP